MSDNKEYLDLLINKVDSISEKQDKIFDQIVEIKLTEIRHTAGLEEHMRRTEIAEKSIEHISNEQEKIYDELLPLQAHVSMINGVVKFIALSAAVVGAVVGLVKLFQ